MTLKPENFISPEKENDKNKKFEPVKLPIRATVRKTSMGTQGKAIESFLFRQISILIKMSSFC